jgi:hypothetical protein
VAKCFPSGEKATAVTGTVIGSIIVLPFQVREKPFASIFWVCSPEFTFQILAVLSRLADANNLPSEENESE